MTKNLIFRGRRQIPGENKAFILTLDSRERCFPSCLKCKNTKVHKYTNTRLQQQKPHSFSHYIARLQRTLLAIMPQLCCTANTKIIKYTNMYKILNTTISIITLDSKERCLPSCFNCAALQTQKI